MAGSLTTVDVKDFARHELRRVEIHDALDDVRRLAHPAHRMQSGQRRIRFGGVHPGLYDPGRDRVHANTTAAHSIASDLVAAFKAPFVSDASTAGTLVIG